MKFQQVNSVDETLLNDVAVDDQSSVEDNVTDDSLISVDPGNVLGKFWQIETDAFAAVCLVANCYVSLVVNFRLNHDRFVEGERDVCKYNNK